MKSVNHLRRLCCLLLCLLLCAGMLLAMAGNRENAPAVSALGVRQVVQVGLCVPENDTCIFASAVTGRGAFTVGLADERVMHALFDLPYAELILLPDRNASVTGEGDTVSGHANDNGNYFAYNIAVGDSYGSYAAARAAASRYADGFVAYTASGYRVRYGHFASEEEAQAAIGGQSGSLSVASPTGNGIAVLDRSDGKQVFEYEGKAPLALCSANGSPVQVQTGDNAREYPGFFSFTASAKLKIVNAVDLETYVKCVMANEIGTNVSRETRRAFSVLIRTVPLNSKHGSHGYDVCCYSCCQAYFGNYRRDSENDEIVDSTKGEYITYNGIPINCLYHASNGGASCSSVAAWGGDEVPYLTTVTLPETEGNASATWQRSYTKQELYEYLKTRPAFKGIADGVSSVSVLETDPYGSGYVTLFSVTDRANNTIEISTSEVVRTALRFQSANFTVDYTMDASVVEANGRVGTETVSGYVGADGSYHEFDSFAAIPVAGSEQTVEADRITFNGVGAGHGVGFSSVGSEQLVSEGYSYRYLISFYFPGTDVQKLR